MENEKSTIWGYFCLIIGFFAFIFLLFGPVSRTLLIMFVGIIFDMLALFMLNKDYFRMRQIDKSQKNINLVSSSKSEIKASKDQTVESLNKFQVDNKDIIDSELNKSIDDSKNYIIYLNDENQHIPSYIREEMLNTLNSYTYVKRHESPTEGSKEACQQALETFNDLKDALKKIYDNRMKKYFEEIESTGIAIDNKLRVDNLSNDENDQ